MKNQNFYRFTNVVVKGKDNRFTPINCYGLNQKQQLIDEDFRR